MDAKKAQPGKFPPLCEKVIRSIIPQDFGPPEKPGHNPLDLGKTILQGKGLRNLPDGGFPLSLFQADFWFIEEFQNRTETTQGAGHQIQAEEGQEKEKPPRVVHVQEAQDP
jgi:hypothetical protein